MKRIVEAEEARSTPPPPPVQKPLEKVAHSPPPAAKVADEFDSWKPKRYSFREILESRNSAPAVDDDDEGEDLSLFKRGTF
jgi:hypothetical protein